jgi:hypothetical protein
MHVFIAVCEARVFVGTAAASLGSIPGEFVVGVTLNSMHLGSTEFPSGSEAGGVPGHLSRQECLYYHGIRKRGFSLVTVVDQLASRSRSIFYLTGSCIFEYSNLWRLAQE